jgi:succinoglycan biosynthesis protein ExoL
MTTSWASHADRVVLTSPYFWTDHYRRLIPWERVIVVENLPSRDDFSAFVSQPHEAFTVLALGRIQYVDELRTLCDVVATEPGVQAIVAGGGPGYEDIREYAHNMRNVVVTGPFRSGPMIADLYARADLVYCVYPTRLRNVRSALPNKLYEAMACHVPIVVSTGTRLSEYVHSHEVGYSVKPGNPDDLRGLLGRLTKDPAGASAVGGSSTTPLFWEDVKTKFVSQMRGLVGEA